MLNGQARRGEDREYEINGFELVATLLPCPGRRRTPGRRSRRSRNIEDIHVFILERNNARQMAERTYWTPPARTRPRRRPCGAACFDTLPASVRHRVYVVQLDCGISSPARTAPEVLLAQAIRPSPPRPLRHGDCATISPPCLKARCSAWGRLLRANPQGKAGFLRRPPCGGPSSGHQVGEIPADPGQAAR